MLLFITYHSKTSLTTAAVSIHLMLLFIHTSFNFMQHLLQFQYISCYSLSSAIPLSYFLKHCFNTSHVTLYLHLPLHRRCRFSRFNTSHVTLYPYARRRTKWVNYVSIHLMLLFIMIVVKETEHTKGFQYISCYSLSQYDTSSRIFFVRFNTSHVTLYRAPGMVK